MISDELRFIINKDRLAHLLEESVMRMHFDDLKRRMSGTVEREVLEQFTQTFLKYPPRPYAMAFRDLSRLLERRRPPRDEDGEYSLPPYSFGLGEDSYDRYVSIDQQRACLYDLVRLCLYEKSEAAFAVKYLVLRAHKYAPWPFNPNNTPPI
jgi:hypothetical protein